MIVDQVLVDRDALYTPKLLETASETLEEMTRTELIDPAGYLVSMESGRVENKRRFHKAPL